MHIKLKLREGVGGSVVYQSHLVVDCRKCDSFRMIHSFCSQQHFMPHHWSLTVYLCLYCGYICVFVLLGCKKKFKIWPEHETVLIPLKICHFILSLLLWFSPLPWYVSVVISHLIIYLSLFVYFIVIVCLSLIVYHMRIVWQRGCFVLYIV